MTQTQPWTVGRLLEWTTDYLRKNRSDSPRLDAEVLLAHARQCQRIQLYTSFAEEPSEPERAAFREMVRRRAEGTPVAYLVGHKEFYSMDLIVTPDVLIPRPETEHVVMEALDRAKQINQGRLPPTGSWIPIADVCSGSGCIGLAIAKHLPNAQVIGMDISPKAIEVAKKNSARCNLDSKIQWIESDLFEKVAGQVFQIIVSNPPYVSQDEYLALPATVKEHEPKLALVAPDHPMSIIERLLDQSPGFLVEGGWLIFEISPMLAGQVQTKIAADPRWTLEKMAKDLAGEIRVVIVRKTSANERYKS